MGPEVVSSRFKTVEYCLPPQKNTEKLKLRLRLRLYPLALKLWNTIFHKPKYRDLKLCLLWRLYPLKIELTQNVFCSFLYILL